MTKLISFYIENIVDMVDQTFPHDVFDWVQENINTKSNYIQKWKWLVYSGLIKDSLISMNAYSFQAVLDNIHHYWTEHQGWSDGQGL
jgi:hypothetical protein